MIEALTGKYDSAIRAGEKSLRLQPASSNRPYPPTVRYLAESYARRGKKDKAIELINRLRHTDNHGNINHRAVPTLQIGDFLKVSQESAYPVEQDYSPSLLT